MRNVISIVLGGGRGTRLYPLTKYRSKPAVPLGGKYRLIDIPLSNCINSGLNRIYVLTQFLSVSLHRHIRQSYRFDRFDSGFVEILAAQQTMEAEPDRDWFQGTADAVRKNLQYIEQPGIDYVLILSGDQLYRMNYRDMLKTHVDTGADVTIAGIPCTRQEARSLGLMRLDDNGRVQGFLEKPQTDPEIDTVRMDPSWIDERGIDSRGRDCVANMGIYLFNRKTLLDLLTKTDDEDFGKQVFPSAVQSQHVQMHLFDGYWEDIGTIRAFYECNLSLAQPDSPFDFRSAKAPIFTRARMLPSALVQNATVKNSLIADGCQIGDDVEIINSVVGLRCAIGSGAKIHNSVLLGADMYEDDINFGQPRADGGPPIGVGPDSVIDGAILDKNCRIGRGVRIVANPEVENAEGEQVMVRDGVPVVLKDAVVEDGWTL